MKKFLQATTLTLSVYGFAGWAYIAMNAVVHLETLHLPLTHLLSWPREDTFGIVCFGVSFISFFLWNLLRNADRT